MYTGRQYWYEGLLLIESYYLQLTFNNEMTNGTDKVYTLIDFFFLSGDETTFNTYPSIQYVLLYCVAYVLEFVNHATPMSKI